MQTRVDQSPPLLMWIASVATTLFCAAGIAVFVAWTPTAIGIPKDHATLTELAPMPTQPAGVKGDKASTTCAECGVIESVREIVMRDERAGESTRSYEITIRFRDGSRRAFNEVTSRMWRSRTEVKVID